MSHKSAVLPPREQAPPSRMTYEEFLEYDWKNPHVEWVDGEVVLMSPTNIVQSDEIGFLVALFREYCALTGGKYSFDPFQMKTGPDLPGRAPDLIYVRPENLQRLHRTFLEGPADIVVEVVSPESKNTDRIDKFSEYEKGGVKEYWVLDPENERADFSRLGAVDRFQIIEIGADGIFRSECMPGFWLRLEWLWPGTQPSLLTVLKEWEVI